MLAKCGSFDSVAFVSYVHTRERRDLVEELERQSGLSFNTRADVDAYISRTHASAATARGQSKFWTGLRQGALALGLAIAFLQYYFMDVYLQIASLRSITPLTQDAPYSAVHSLFEVAVRSS